MENLEALVISALLAQIETADATMREQIASADKGVAAAGTLIVGGLAFAIAQQSRVVFLALPYGLVALMYWILQKYTDRLRTAGYRTRIEELLNAHLEDAEHAVMRASMVLKANEQRPDELAAAVIYSVAVVGLCIVGIYAAKGQVLEGLLPGWLERNLFPIHVVAMSLFAASLLVPFRQMVSAYDLGYERALAPERARDDTTKDKAQGSE